MNLPFLVSLAVGAVALVAAGWIAFRSIRVPRQGRRARRHADPAIVFPVRTDVKPVPGPAAAEPVPPGPAASRPTPPATPATEPEPASAPAATAASAPAAPGPESELVEGHTIRFYRPPEGTLQLLPGRLEVVDGLDHGQEIRFIRSEDGTPEITFGRSNGPPHRHIQLRASTVSREHARMRLDAGEWKINNLSRTNPVVVNGEELRASNGGRRLAEGDRIEMGEVVFVFRER